MIDHRRLKAARRNLKHRTGCENRVPPHTRTVFDRLEKETWRSALIRQDKSPICKHGREVIAQQAPREQHQWRFGALPIERGA